MEIHIQSFHIYTSSEQPNRNHKYLFFLCVNFTTAIREPVFQKIKRALLNNWHLPYNHLQGLETQWLKESSELKKQKK